MGAKKLSKAVRAKAPPSEACVHPYYAWTHGGQCMGCRKTPLSPNLPDHHTRKLRDAHTHNEDAA